MLAVAAQACVEEPKLVHQAATGDSNPNTIDRIVGKSQSESFPGKESGFKLPTKLSGAWSRVLFPPRVLKFSVPMFNSAAKKASTLDRARPRWGGASSK
jgi:hypothetical protein